MQICNILKYIAGSEENFIKFNITAVVTCFSIFDEYFKC